MIYLLPTKHLGLMKIPLSEKRFDTVIKLAHQQRITFNQTLAMVLSDVNRGVTSKFESA